MLRLSDSLLGATVQDALARWELSFELLGYSDERDNKRFPACLVL